MNKCKKCGETDKTKLVKSGKYYRNWCKKCHYDSRKEYNKEYKRHNRPERKQYMHEYSKVYRKRNRLKLSEEGKKYHSDVRNKWLVLLDTLGCNKCSKCGYDKCFKAIEFHHRDPDKKDIIISKLLYFTINDDNVIKLLKELDKCDVLCSNCHRELHAAETENNGYESRPKDR